MKLWMVRHAQPLVEAGICYGASDMAADSAATQTAAQSLASVLPYGVCVISSPLQRCEQLAQHLRGLRPDLAYEQDARLQEMDFGQWEGQRWDAITRAELDGWTEAFDSWRCGGAESVADVMCRVIRAAALLARGVRQVHRADQWPAHGPAFGQWQLADI